MSADFAELTAFTEESRVTEETLAGIDADAWARPGLGSWSVAELVAHMVRGAGRVAAYAVEDPGGPPSVDRLDYWRYDADAEGPAIAARAVSEAAAVEPAELPGRFTEAWQASAATARERGPDSPIWTIRGSMRLDDYLSSRVVEAVLHHLDLRIALDLPPVATPPAARMTMEILEGLLGEPRPRNLGRTRFLLAATGRIDVGDPRFPVLR